MLAGQGGVESQSPTFLCLSAHGSGRGCGCLGTACFQPGTLPSIHAAETRCVRVRLVPCAFELRRPLSKILETEARGSSQAPAWTRACRIQLARLES